MSVIRFERHDWVWRGLGAAYFFIFGALATSGPLYRVPLLILPLMVLLWRNVIVFDLERREVFESRGPFVPFVDTLRIKFSQFQFMLLRRNGSRLEDGDEEPGQYFVEALRAGILWRVAETTRYLKARQIAELFAKNMGLGIFDQTIREFREVGTLDEPLSDRIRRKGSLQPLPMPPPGLFVRVVNGELQVDHRARYPYELGETHTEVRVSRAGFKVTIREGTNAILDELSAGVLDSVGIASNAAHPGGYDADVRRILALSSHREISFAAGWPHAQQEWIVLAIQHALSTDTVTLPVSEGVDAQ